MTVDEFRELILVQEVDDILVNILLSDNPKHVDKNSQNFIKQKICEVYKIVPENLQLYIVGSSNLGFSITKKKKKDGGYLPRYRPFRPDSDIDIAVISPQLYEIIWNELSRFSFSQPYLPWDSGKLGDYMVCGWLRPDYFPNRRLRKCDDWWDTFRRLSSQQRFGRRQVRGGLFYNFEQLKSYQSKALIECIEHEKLSK